MSALPMTMQTLSTQRFPQQLKHTSRTRVVRVRSSISVKQSRGAVSGEGLRIGVVVALFNDIITRPLLTGALEAFSRHGVKDEDVEIAWVPGSFEVPLIAQEMAQSGKFDAVLCIGAVVRGDTTHYDAVANNAASGVLSAGLKARVPCIFGVLTCDTMEQAINRAGGKAGNKGAEAAVTAIETANLLRSLRASGSAAPL